MVEDKCPEYKDFKNIVVPIIIRGNCVLVKTRIKGCNDETLTALDGDNLRKLANYLTKNTYYWVQTIIKDGEGRLEVDKERKFNKLKDAVLYRMELIDKDKIGYAFDYYIYIGDEEGDFLSEVKL
jgi:hypothetical protein